MLLSFLDGFQQCFPGGYLICVDEDRAKERLAHLMGVLYSCDALYIHNVQHTFITQVGNGLRCNTYDILIEHTFNLVFTCACLYVYAAYSRNAISLGD